MTLQENDLSRGEKIKIACQFSNLVLLRIHTLAIDLGKICFWRGEALNQY